MTCISVESFHWPNQHAAFGHRDNLSSGCASSGEIDDRILSRDAAVGSREPRDVRGDRLPGTCQRDTGQKSVSVLTTTLVITLDRGLGHNAGGQLRHVPGIVTLMPGRVTVAEL